MKLFSNNDQSATIGAQSQTTLTQQGDMEETKNIEFSDEEDLDKYFKFGNPIYLQELDWAITLSKFDFPWTEIKFNKWTTKECFEKYSSSIKDASSFLKRVLGQKEKFKKLMANQVNEPSRVFGEELLTSR